MKLHRDAIWNIVIVLGVLGVAAWFVTNTYWAMERVRDPAQGEAATDQHYAAKKLIARLGGKTVSPTNLDRLPPTNATLVLSAWNYDLFPERDKKLREWVEAGGHIVSDQWKRPAWIGLENKNIEDKKARRPPPAASAASANPPPPRRPRGRLLPSMPPPSAADCFNARESLTPPAAYDAPREFRLCTAMEDVALTSKKPIIWSLDGKNGPAVARVAIGRGQATVALGTLSDNSELFEGDHALVLVAALDLAHRPEVWFVDTESRDPLLRLIWRTGKPAVLIGLALIALALWRAIPRFGPREPVAPLSRRSVAEQIRGTSSFIFQRDSTALLQAQWRALEQAGRRTIRDHDKLDRRARAEAIGKATALDASALARALDPSLKRHRRDLLATLALLETAVRRLTLNR